MLCVLRQCSRPEAGACLFTELSRQFVFVWGHVIERRSLIMAFSFPSFSSFILYLSYFFFSPPAAVLVQLGLFAIQNVRSNTDLYLFHKHTLQYSCVFTFPAQHCRRHKTAATEKHKSNLNSIVRTRTQPSSWPWGQFTNSGNCSNAQKTKCPKLLSNKNSHIYETAVSKILKLVFAG